MKIPEKLSHWLKKAFATRPGKDKKEKQPLTPEKYIERLTAYLTNISSGKAVKLKKKNMRNIWHCDVETLHDAYLLYISLPDVASSEITLKYIADTLYYTVKVHETMMLELANRAKGKDSVATITLYKESEKLLQIKFKLTL